MKNENKTKHEMKNEAGKERKTKMKNNNENEK